MRYTVMYEVNGRETGSEQVEGIEAVKLLVVNAVEAGAATRAEARDEAGDLVYQHPRTVIASPGVVGRRRWSRQ